jgi:peptidyl-tRNA hydrolase, PTH1 family
MLNFLPLVKAHVLVIGLGNPGGQYYDTPHNAGFDVVDTLASRIDSEDFAIKELNKKRVTLFEVRMAGRSTVLAKPQVFMNNSGEVAAQLAKRYRLANLGSLWLVHDDIDLPLGKLRVTFNRSSGGHGGVRSVIEHLGSNQFYRFRFGIRPPDMPERRSSELMRNYVTRKMTRTPFDAFAKTSHLCADLIYQGLTGTPILELLGDHNVPRN